MAKRKDVPTDFEIEALVSEKVGLEKDDHPEYRVTIEGDDRGWERKYVIYAEGPTWTEKFQGQPLVTIEDHDCDLEVKIHKPGSEPVKFAISLGDIADLRVLLEVVNRVKQKQSSKGLGMFAKNRITKTTIKRELKRELK